MFLSRSSQGVEPDFCRIADTKTSLHPLMGANFMPETVGVALPWAA
jgi:hypothetical protein